MWAPFVASLVTGSQFARAAAFADGFFFSAQAGIDQTEHTKRRPIIGLFAHYALDFDARRGEGSSRCRVVPESARDTALHEGD